MCRTPCSVFLGILLCASASADPSINKHINKADVTAIIHAVKQRTNDPILHIETVVSTKPYSGSIPYDTLMLDRFGTRHATMYERTDLVEVSTEKPSRGGGSSYTVQKSKRGWKVVRKGHWIN